MVTDRFQLTGRTAFVTGCFGHVGQSICAVLAELGATVIGSDVLSQSDWGRSETLLSASNVELDFVPIDLSSSSAMEEGVLRVKALTNRVDILVNNAATVKVVGPGGAIKGLVDESDEAFRIALDVNLVAPFALVRELLPLLRESGNASIINVASIYGLLGPVPHLYEGTEMTSHAAYAASKGGLVQLTRYLATMLAPGIRVNAIAPGGLERNQEASFVDRYVQRTPMARMGRESDLEGAVAWLAGDAASYVTGQVIAIDGGWTSW